MSRKHERAEALLSKLRSVALAHDEPPPIVGPLAMAALEEDLERRERSLPRRPSLDVVPVLAEVGSLIDRPVVIDRAQLAEITPADP